MQLSNEAIKEFREIYRKEFKEDIDEPPARERAERLLNLVKVIYRPLTHDRCDRPPNPTQKN